MSRWYRAYEGTITDAKLAEVAMVAGCSRSVVIASWHALLENAACVNDGGRIDIPSRRIAAVLCEPFDVIESVLLGFEAVGLLVDSQISSWKKRQFESDSSTERSRRHRSAKRNGDATLQQQDATPPETETETEKITVSDETVVGKPVELNGHGSEPPVRCQMLTEAWNAVAAPAGAVECRRMGDERRRKANVFLRRYPVEDITEAIGAVGRSDFLCGRTKENFRADIEFLFTPKHMTRLLEGFYDRTTH